MTAGRRDDAVITDFACFFEGFLRSGDFVEWRGRTYTGLSLFSQGWISFDG